ncbi:aspartyl-phosphate phosphatase Spo0E family protein [Paenibacillus endophyticus]|uniref:aspartyl-phosphate phosphatase Spo0E family protein n=1 Tax=Paenibacillus endophyticus TaxID=1294268 RepID=UPI0035E41095
MPRRYSSISRIIRFLWEGCSTINQLHDKAKLEQAIERLRQEMVDKLLMNQSYQSDEVLGASQALDRILNCYDCVRYGRECGSEIYCAYTDYVVNA